MAVCDSGIIEQDSLSCANRLQGIGYLPDLGWDESGGEIMPGEAGTTGVRG